MKDIKVAYKTVAYNPVYAMISGDVASGLFLSQLIEWCDWGAGDGWICKTQSEWQGRTAIRLNQQTRIRRNLKRLGFIEERLEGWPRTLYVRLNMPAIEEAINRLGE